MDMVSRDPEKKSIRDWSESDRPREKLLMKGKNALSEAELIAILIGSGNLNDSAVDLSKKILDSVNNNLIELSRLSVDDLTKFQGIGPAKAISIVSALELGRRRRGAEAIERKRIRSSRDAYEVFQPLIGDENEEQFAVIMLTNSNDVIKTDIISKGGITGTVADPKRIFRLALETKAVNIILGHNHPSGNISPSDADVKLTNKIKSAGSFLEIGVLDHIIIGPEKYFSFTDEGLI